MLVATKKLGTALLPKDTLANGDRHGGLQPIGSKISAKPQRTPRPACKVHGAAAVVVQLAWLILSSTASQRDPKHRN